MYMCVCVCVCAYIYIYIYIYIHTWLVSQKIDYQYKFKSWMRIHISHCPDALRRVRKHLFFPWLW